jgi:Type II intron maturase
MSQKISERLENLRKLNSNRQWENKDLYRLMFNEDLYVLAYEGKTKGRNLTYHALAERKRRLARQGKSKTKEFKDLVRKLRSLPTVEVNDPEYIRIKFLRYADDWIVGLCGSHALAEEIKQEIKQFLKDHLELTLSEEKTHITNARTEETHFLGTILRIGTGGEAKLALTTNTWGRKFKRRSTGWETVMKAPLPNIIKRLKERGFCTPEGKPVSKASWTLLDTDQIINLYRSVNRGLQNYYRFVDNWGRLTRIQYILEYSLAKTLAQKYKISVRKVFKRFGKTITTTIKGTGGREDRQVVFFKNRDWKKQRDAFQAGNRTEIDRIQMAITMRTRSKLGKACCTCGENTARTVMHHVRHVRKLSQKREATGFNRILRIINRKQIPVCKACHERIHRGEYDDLKISDLAYIPR